MIFNPYSISKLGTYSHCPKQFEFKYVNKVKVPFTYNVALYKGSYIHKIIEEDYNYDTDFKINETFTAEKKAEARKIVETFEASTLGILYKSKTENALHEEKFGIKVQDGSIVICSYYDKTAWMRGAIDFQYTEDGVAYNIDWKSGKNKSNDKDFGIDQSMAYSIYLFLKYPNINVIKSKFVFVEHLDEKEIVYVREKFAEYIKHFYNKTKILEADKFYEPKTGPLCEWCDYEAHGFCKVPEEKQKASEDFMKMKIDF